MTDPDNRTRFSGLADIYADHRPTYAAEVIEALAERASAGDVPKVAIDIGCGTGIATLLLADALPDWQIIAAEPNEDMLEKARAVCKGRDNIRLERADASTLPSDEGAIGLVLAAQALHWFDIEAFFAEAARVLAPNGTLAILYNNRVNEASAALLEIEDYLESADVGYSRAYRERDIPALLAAQADFDELERVRKVWLKQTSSDDLVNYFMSRSVVQPVADKFGVSKLRHRIGDIADECAEAGYLSIPFASELDTARRV